MAANVSLSLFQAQVLPLKPCITAPSGPGLLLLEKGACHGY